MTQDIFSLARKRDVDGLTALLDGGADPNTVDADGRTALWYGTGPCVRLLLERGADPNVTGPDDDGPFMSQVQAGKPDGALALIEHGLDPSSRRRDFHGMTPLMLAAYFGSYPAASALLPLTPDPEARDDQGATAFDHAVEGAHLETWKYWSARQKKGCARWVRELDTAARLPLAARARNALIPGDAAALANCLDAGLSVDTRLVSVRGGVPFDPRESIDIAAGGLADFVLPPVDERQEPTLLMWAAARGHPSAVRLLLERGADPGLVDDTGAKAVDHARFHGHTDVVALLG